MIHLCSYLQKLTQLSYLIDIFFILNFELHISDILIFQQTFKSSLKFNCLDLFCFKGAIEKNEVKYFSMESAGYDIVCFTETRLTDNIKNLYEIKNYNLFSNQRNRQGGRVAIYIKSFYSSTV